MVNFLKSSLIDELCENRRNELSRKVIKNSKEYKEIRDKVENKLKSFLNYVVAEHYEYVEKEMENVLFKYVLEFVEYWDNLFYKFGFVDGLNLKEQVKKVKEEMEKNEMEDSKKVLDSFMNDSGNSFMQQFEKAREEHLLNREDYKELHNKMNVIMEEFPKARSFLQDGIITDMTDDEKDAVLRIIDLKEKMKILEYKEAFKLGGKEMYIFLEEMGMLNI